MKRWMIGGIVGAIVGVGLYLLVTRKAEPVRQSALAQPAPVVAAAPPAVPVVLPEVVDLIDLDPLLDPPVRISSGEPFEVEPGALPVRTSTAPDRIPPAAEEKPIETAPFPHRAVIVPVFGPGGQLLGIRFQF